MPSVSATTTATRRTAGVSPSPTGVPNQVAFTEPAISSLNIPDILTGKTPYEHIPVTRQIYHIIRALYIFVVAECPLFWGWLFMGGRNDRADVEGPFYISGAPNLQIADGKAILASREDFEANPPYLLSLRILSPSGEPMPYAKLDFWQATSSGLYFNSKYRLRGVFQADTPDDAEYKNVERLTTQIYVTRRNETKDMEADFVNYVRHVRFQNMIHSLATSAFYPPMSSRAYAGFAKKYAFPPISPTSLDALKSIEWWNTVLAQRFPRGEQLQVLCGGETMIKLNNKT
ncbi:hypothetical protein EUX98_g3312 [Antrodiella citrinella]|uniref:Uncharacterized protein n=1 Tax=Antrodiella citrinella TaxID=2447956 RepID=A0A4V6S1W2_9APHY|nr:hypothetical protein EUX98_g3312 [Antrodiella citrinella]